MSECRLRCADATLEEIANLIALKAPAIMQDRSVVRPIGLLISAIPKCFEGTAILHFRKRWAAEKDAQRRKEQEEAQQRAQTEWWFQRERSRCEAVLQDATATDAQRRSAEAQLNQINAVLAENREHEK